MGKFCLNNILYLFSYISSVNIISIKANSTFGKTDQGFDITYNIYRKQLKLPHASLTPPEIPGHKKKTGEDDGYYDPYWADGDWVFNRQASTNRPQAFFLNLETTKKEQCNQVCIKIYQEYGPVCGMRLSRKEWEYETKTFENMCHLELANCGSKSKRHAWYPAKHGSCVKWLTTHPTDSTALVHRLSSWLKPYT